MNVKTAELEGLTKEEIYETLPLFLRPLARPDRESVECGYHSEEYGPTLFWVGFYLVKGDELVLGPFQGLPASHRRVRLRQRRGGDGDRIALKVIDRLIVIHL